MTFVDIGVKQIQGYLARSRHLWGRRGASEELVVRTSREQLSAIIDRHSGVGFNPGAPRVDSVVNLEGPPTETRECAHDIARVLKETMPEITFEITVHDVDSYALTWLPAYSAAEKWSHLPSLNDYPPARLCEECGSSPATSAKDVRGERLYLCQDCAMRIPAPGRRDAVVKVLHVAASSDDPDKTTAESALIDVGHEGRDLGSSHFAPEVKLLGLLNRQRRQLDPQAGLLTGVADFTELARQDSHSTRPRTVTDNHLALVFADANGLGGLFTQLRRDAAQEIPAVDAEGGVGESHARVLQLSEWVKEVTWQSLLAATAYVTLPDDLTCPVVPHVVGGDDVTLSIAATRAWPFVEHFLQVAEQRFGDPPPGLRPLLTGTAQPSMSAGVVICRARFPFGSQVELADQAMVAAKKAVRGTCASVSWLDVTYEGEQLVDDRQPVTLSELVRRRPMLERVFSLPGATRDSLRRAVAESDEELALLQLALLAHRIEHVRQVLVDIGGANWEQLPPQQWDAAAADRLRRDVRDALSLTRWWSPWNP